MYGLLYKETVGLKTLKMIISLMRQLVIYHIYENNTKRCYKVYLFLSLIAAEIQLEKEVLVPDPLGAFQPAWDSQFLPSWDHGRQDKKKTPHMTTQLMSRLPAPVRVFPMAVNCSSAFRDTALSLSLSEVVGTERLVYRTADHF